MPYNFNLNLGGLGEGAFKLDPSKFDFSAYAPTEEPEVEPVVVTKQAPKTPQRTTNNTSAVPKGMDFGIAPINITSTPSQGMLSSVTEDPYAVSQKDLDRNQRNLESSLEVLSGITSGVDGFGLSSISRDASISQEQADSIFDLVASDDFSSMVSSYTDAMEGKDKRGLAQDSRSVLTALGAPSAFKVNGQYGGYKQYQFDADTNSYIVIHDNTLSKDAMIAETVIKAAPVVVATAGIGNAIAGSSALSGLSPAVAKGVGQAVASGVVSGVQGGGTGDVLKSAALGGLGGYAKGLNEAAAQAQVAADVYGASYETVKKASELAAQAQVANNVKTGINLVRAIDSGNVLGVIANTLKLSGLDGPQTVIEDYIHDDILSETAGMGESAVEDWLFYNSDHVATAALNLLDQVGKGADFDETIKSVTTEYIMDGGGFSDLIPDGSTPEFIKGIGDAIKESASAANTKFVKPIMDVAGEIVDPIAETVRETGREIREDVAPVTEAVRETGREIREDVAPVTEAVRETGRDVRETASELNEEYVKPVAEAADEVVETVKDYGDEFGDLANNLIKGMLGGLAAGIGGSGGSQSASRGSQPVGEFLEPKLVRGFDLDQPFVNPLLRG